MDENPVNKLYCIFKNGEAVFSSRDPPQLLYNIISGFDDIGMQLFSERIRLIRVFPILIQISFREEFTVVVIGESEDEILEIIKRHESVADSFINPRLIP